MQPTRLSLRQTEAVNITETSAHLACLIGRQAGERHQSICVVSGTGRKRRPSPTRAAKFRPRTLTVPARLTISETRKLNGSGKQLVPAIFLTNPTSLNNKVDELYANILKFAPDVVCISEVWQLDNSKAQLPGFNFFQRPRLHRRGGGVGCYVNQRIPVKLLSYLQPDEEDVEVMWLQVRPKHLPAGSSNICIAVVYYPPGARANLRVKYEEHLQYAIDELRTTYNCPRFLICGDFNSFPVKSLCHLTGLQQIVTAPTHGSSVLDVIMTDLGDYYHEPEMLSPLGRSKHVIVFARPRAIQPAPRERTVVRMLPDSGVRAFGRWITAHDWSPVYGASSPDEQVAVLQ